MTAVRIGAQLPSSGWTPSADALVSAARELESAGFDSLWVSDHIVMPATIRSHYPFHPDGEVTWPTAVPWLEALIALSLAAAVTERVTLGTDVLLLGLRNPVAFAKQAASLDVASGGRLVVGVGAGWLAEEFDALDVPFAGRGARLDEWMEIAGELWSGGSSGRASELHELPADLHCLPAPARPIPWLVGGHSPAALRRAGRAGGWLGQQALGELDPPAIERARAVAAAEARRLGRDPEQLRVVLRIVESAGRAAEVARALPALARAGVHEVIVDLDWERDDPRAALAALRAGTGEPSTTSPDPRNDP